MIRAIIIDDEESGVQLLSKLIRKRHPEITLLEPAFDMEEAIQAIDRHKPDLLFLDIRLGTDNGFDVLEKTVFKDYHVIFVTAYGQYALKAIKKAALDYLLKPIDMEDLERAITRFKNAQKPAGIAQLQAIKTVFDDQKRYQKLVIPTKDGFEFVNKADVLYAIADENYTSIHLATKRSRFASKNLGYFEQLLSPPSFFRIHKSHLINLSEVAQYEHGNGGFVKMSDGKRLEVSRRKKKELLSLLETPLGIRADK